MYDMKNLSKLSILEQSAEEGMKSFWKFDQEAFKSGHVSSLNKQLAAVAVALTTQCPYCIELHATAAKDAGATDEQLSEIALVAAAIRAGGAITHATHMFDIKD